MRFGSATAARLSDQSCSQVVPFAVAMPDKVSPGWTVWCAGGAAAGCSETVATISDLASPATAILNMSGFLLRLVRHKVPAGCCEHLAGTALASGRCACRSPPDTREGAVTRCHGFLP